MIRTRAEAKKYLANFERKWPGAFALARALSLAARVEPELLRAMRLRLFPQLTAGNEADLWFSNCVESSGPLWILFDPVVAEELRADLSARSTRDDAQRAREIIVTMHTAVAPLVKLEESVHWLSLRRNRRTEIEAALGPVLQAVREQDDEGVAQWAAHAIPRFSSWVRDLPIAWAIRIIAEQRLGGTVSIDPHAEALPEEAAMLLRDLLPTTEIWVRLVRDTMLEVSRDRLLGGHAIEVAATNPIVLTVSDSSGSRNVQLRGALQRIPIRGEVVIRSMTGATWELTPTESRPRSYASFRFAAMAPLTSERFGDVHAIFTTPSKQGAVLEGAPEYNNKLRVFLDDHLPVVLVSEAGRNPKLWEPLAQEQRRLFGSHPFVPGKRPGDFATTVEADGALVGIIGLNTSVRAGDVFPSVDADQFEQVCGGSPVDWIARHHAAILVLPDLMELRKTSSETMLEIARWDFSFLVHRSERSMEFREQPPVVAIPTGDPLTGELQIGIIPRLEIRRPGTESIHGRVAVRLHPVPIDIPDPERWVLVAGSSRNLEPLVENVARSIGHELVRAGFGLITGGWDGVDVIVTRAYADALKTLGVSDVSRFIRHILGTIQPRPEIPGQRLSYYDDKTAGAESVRRSDAVILIGGRGAAASIGNEAIQQQKFFLPLPQTGGAAVTFPLPKDVPLRKFLEPNVIAQAAVAVVAREIVDELDAERSGDDTGTSPKKARAKIVRPKGSMYGQPRKRKPAKAFRDKTLARSKRKRAAKSSSSSRKAFPVSSSKKRASKSSSRRPKLK